MMNREETAITDAKEKKITSIVWAVKIKQWPERKHLQSLWQRFNSLINEDKCKNISKWKISM